MAHTEASTVLLSSVTAPVRASARPRRLAPVVIVILANATMFPTNWVPVPSVAELVTCQNTLHGAPAPVRRTTELLAVVSAESNFEDEHRVGVGSRVERQGSRQAGSGRKAVARPV